MKVKINGHIFILLINLFRVKYIIKNIMPIIPVDSINSKLKLIKNNVNKEKKIIKKVKLSPSLKRGKKNAKYTRAEPGSGCNIIKIDGINK